MYLKVVGKYYSSYKTGHQLYSIFRQASWVAVGFPTEKGDMQEVLNIIRSSYDCNDFTLNGLLRLVYLDEQQKYIPEKMKPAVKSCILDFKYWWNDHCKDTTYRCYYTEESLAFVSHSRVIDRITSEWMSTYYDVEAFCVYRPNFSKPKELFFICLFSCESF